VLVVRCEQRLPEEPLKKMAMFCSVAPDRDLLVAA